MRLMLRRGVVSPLPISKLWQEALGAVMTDLNLTYGYGTADGDAPGGEVLDGWYMKIQLAPAGVGELLMIGMELDNSMSFEFLPGPLARGNDLDGVLRRAGDTMKDRHKMHPTMAAS